MLKKERSDKKNEIEEILRYLSSQTRLLVASDFDGTISTYTEDPHAAGIDPTARVALARLSELPGTHAAIISGRSLSDLRVKLPELDRVRLIGSHGHEFDLDQIAVLTADQREALHQAEALVKDAADWVKGARVERKSHGVAFHYRGAETIPETELKGLRAALQKLNTGVVREGKMVMEYAAVNTDKGEALRRIRQQIAPTATLFIGDDLTDEAAFSSLDASDISIKVGSGETLANFRVDSPQEVVSFLARLAEHRSVWIRSFPEQEIDQHIFISDLRTAALVDRSGNVSWLCTPRIDGTPLFGWLVGGPASGHFRISSSGKARQEYLSGSLVGRTTFDGITVTDFFDCSGGRTYQRAGRTDLIRIVEGSGEVTVEFAPKFNFGRVPTRLHPVEDGLSIECGQHRMVLKSPGWEWHVSREGTHDAARSRRLLNDEITTMILYCGTATAPSTQRPVSVIREETLRFWSMWLDTLKLPKNQQELVARSALVLRGLCYGPTGAIAAAATTSLPEEIGGIRNWDYRFCWPRDAALAASALLRIGAHGPAMRLLDWLLSIVLDADESDRFLAPLYTVTGRHVLGEAEIPEALGYRNSRPVRIGNLAADQLQLDSLGPIAELMLNLSRTGASMTDEHLQLAGHLVSLVQSRWHEPDSGIWEVRGAQRHFVHSKVMCWYTVHCCCEVAAIVGTERPDWRELESKIRQEIETKGFSEKYDSYVAAYDLEEADGALLWIVLSRFHPPEHPRSITTVRYIQQNLVHDNQVFRYRFDDALQGNEGEFVICRLWLIEALVLIGNKSEARKLFDQFLSRVSPLGLLSEQWDGRRNCALGNYPQAYSHIGLINCACSLDSNADNSGG